MLSKDGLFQGAGVHADPDGHASFFGPPDDPGHAIPGADVAGVEPQAVHPLFQGLKGEPVVEVNVGDERDFDSPLDFTQSFGCLPVGDGNSDDLAPGFRERPGLGDGGSDVPGVRLGHGLNHNGRAPADWDGSDMDPAGHLARQAGGRFQFLPQREFVVREPLRAGKSIQKDGVLRVRRTLFKASNLLEIIRDEEGSQENR